MFKIDSKASISTSRSWAPIIITLFLTWLLLLQRLGGPSFWVDELLSFKRASLPDWDSFYKALLDANHAPLYERFILHPWLLLGDGEFWVRIPGIMLAMITISLTYRMGRQVMDARTGIFGIVFLVFSPLFFQHVREVRPYSLLVLTTTLSIYFWKEAMSSGNRKYWLLLTLFGTATIYTHYYSGFVLIGMAVTTIVLKLFGKTSWKRIYQATFAFLGITILFMPWFPTFLKQLQSGAVSWIPPLSLRSFFELPTYFFAHTIFPESIWNGLIILTWGLFALAMILLWKLKGMGKPLIILISLFFFSLLAVILASIQKPLLIPRYFVSLTPVVALIAAYITIWTVSEKKIAFLFVPILLLLGAGYSVFALTYFDRTPDWRSAANYIQEMAEPEDKIVLFSGQMGGASLPLIYYLGDSWLVMANSGTLEDESAVELVLADLVPTNRVWLIQSTRRTPSRSLNYQPNLAYGPYVLLRREVFDDRAIKPHLSIDLWLLEVAQP